MQQPTIGRIVYYQQHRDQGPAAAMITRVHDAEAGIIDLTIFPAGSGPFPVTGRYPADVHALTMEGVWPEGTWAWPGDAATIEGAAQGLPAIQGVL